MLTMAIAKGRIAEMFSPTLQELGILSALPEDHARQLIMFSPDEQVRYLLVKASDVLRLVRRGIADVGLVGEDVLLEANWQGPIDSYFEMQQCRMVIAAPATMQTIAKDKVLRIASKYPNISCRLLPKILQGYSCQVIPMAGSLELAPQIGLAEVIVDIVQTGATLRQNNLKVIKELFKVYTCLITGPQLVRAKMEPLLPLIKAKAVDKALIERNWGGVYLADF